jgi:hypothetical protein
MDTRKQRLWIHKNWWKCPAGNSVIIVATAESSRREGGGEVLLLCIRAVPGLVDAPVWAVPSGALGCLEMLQPAPTTGF